MTLASLIGSTLITSGCVGQNSGTGSSANTKADLAVKSQSGTTSETGDSKMWLDIAGKDGAGVDSKSYLYLQNNEATSEEFAGCDSVPWAEVHIQDYIPPNGLPPMTKDIPAKWTKVFGKDGSMLSPKYLNSNYIAFNSQAKVGDKLNCYFNSEDISTGKILTKKMTFEVAQHKTSGAETKNEVELALKDEVKNSPVSPAQLADMAISDVNMEDYVHKYDQDQANSRGSKFGRYVNLVANHHQVKLHQRIGKNMINLSRYFDNLAVSSDPSIIRVELYRIKHALGLRGNSSDLMLRSAAQGFYNIKDRKLVVIKEGSRFIYAFESIENDKRSVVNIKEALIQNGINPTTNIFEEVGLERIAEVADDSSLSSKSIQASISKKIKEKLLPGSDVLAPPSIETGGLNEEEQKILKEELIDSTTNNAVIGNIQPAKQSVSLKRHFIGAGVGVTVFIGLMVWLSEVFNKKADSAYGDKTSNILEVGFGTATAGEVSAWNSSHDAGHQIAADSTVLQNPANNAAHQEAKFFFSGNDVSGNVGVSMGLMSMSNPHHRFEDNDDPWLGGIGEGSKERYSSVNLLSFGPASNAGPIQTIDYQMARVQAQEKGIPVISVDDRLDAPQLNLDKVVNTKTDQVMYASGMNGSVFAPGKLGMSVDGFDGLYLNPGEDVKFNVQLPTSGNAADDIIGGAYAVDFNSTDESAIVPMPVQSKSLKAKYDRKDTANGETKGGLAYLYNHFDCAYDSAAGKNCPLTLAVGNLDDEKHDGILTVSNQASRPTEIPVHMNYRLLEKPERVNVAPTSRHGKEFTLTLGNAGSEAYTGMEISDLPEGIEEVSSSCDNGLAAGKSCQITFDASQMNPEEIGSDYTINIKGITEQSANGKGLLLVKKSSGMKSEVNPRGADVAQVHLSIVE